MALRSLLLLGAVAAALTVAPAAAAAPATRCDALSAAGFERLGVQAMERTHELMGRRLAGCRRRSASWSWMRAGMWRQMTAGDWRPVRSAWMGPGMMRADTGGWSAAAVAAVAAVAALAAAAVALVLAKRRPARM